MQFAFLCLVAIAMLFGVNNYASYNSVSTVSEVPTTEPISSERHYLKTVDVSVPETTESQPVKLYQNMAKTLSAESGIQLLEEVAPTVAPTDEPTEVPTVKPELVCSGIYYKKDDECVVCEGHTTQTEGVNGNTGCEPCGEGEFIYNGACYSSKCSSEPFGGLTWAETFAFYSDYQSCDDETHSGFKSRYCDFTPSVGVWVDYVDESQCKEVKAEQNAGVISLPITFEGLSGLAGPEAVLAVSRAAIQQFAYSLNELYILADTSYSEDSKTSRTFSLFLGSGYTTINSLINNLSSTITSFADNLVAIAPSIFTDVTTTPKTEDVQKDLPDAFCSTDDISMAVNTMSPYICDSTNEGAMAYRCAQIDLLTYLYAIGYVNCKPLAEQSLSIKFMYSSQSTAYDANSISAVNSVGVYRTLFKAVNTTSAVNSIEVQQYTIEKQNAVDTDNNDIVLSSITFYVRAVYADNQAVFDKLTTMSQATVESEFYQIAKKNVGINADDFMLVVEIVN